MLLIFQLYKFQSTINQQTNFPINLLFHLLFCMDVLFLLIFCNFAVISVGKTYPLERK